MSDLIVRDASRLPAASRIDRFVQVGEQLEHASQVVERGGLFQVPFGRQEGMTVDLLVIPSPEHYDPSMSFMDTLPFFMYQFHELPRELRDDSTDYTVHCSWGSRSPVSWGAASFRMGGIQVRMAYTEDLELSLDPYTGSSDKIGQAAIPEDHFAVRPMQTEAMALPITVEGEQQRRIIAPDYSIQRATLADLPRE